MRAIVCGLLLGLAAIGCSGSGGPPKATVTGKVLLDGKPLESGAMTFVPSDGQGPTAGCVIEQGTYSVELTMGPKKVEITSSKVIGKQPADKDIPGSPIIDLVQQILPPNYNTNSELTLEVTPESSQKDFDLKSK